MNNIPQDILDAELKSLEKIKKENIVGLKGMATTVGQEAPVAVGFIQNNLNLPYSKIEIELGLVFKEETELKNINSEDDLKKSVGLVVALEFLNPPECEYLHSVANNGYFSNHKIVSYLDEDLDLEDLEVQFIDQPGQENNIGKVTKLKKSSPFFAGLEMLKILKELGSFDLIPKDFLLITGSLVTPLEESNIEKILVSVKQDNAKIHEVRL